MSGWALATGAAIWILIIGSLVVFGWFLLEVVRLARRRRGTRPGSPRRTDAALPEDPRAGPQ